MSNYDDNEQVDIISGVSPYVPRRRERLAREVIDSDEEFMSKASEIEEEDVESELEEIVDEREEELDEVGIQFPRRSTRERKAPNRYTPALFE